MDRRLILNDALWSVVTQLVIAVGFFPVVWVIWRLNAAGSFTIGGLLCALPHVYLYRRVFSQSGARAAKHIVRAFYWGEMVKFALTAVGFVGALFIPWIQPLWLFIGYIVNQAGFWLAPIFLGCWRVKKMNQIK